MRLDTDRTCYEHKHLIVMGIRPLGAFPFGALADSIGVSGALAAGVVLSVGISVGLFATNGRLRAA